MKKACFLIMFCVFMLTIASVPDALCYPPAGSDYMASTTTNIQLEIETEIISMNLVGSTTVSRGTPYDPDDGRMKIDTEIVSMHLTGTSSNIGPITIVESPTKTSNGTIRQLSHGVDFPAESFFDVFVEINTTLDHSLHTLHNDDPVPLTATIYSIPPWGSIYRSPLISISLKNENNNTIGFIKQYSHRIELPVGGILVPVDKFVLLAPYIALASTILIATAATAIYVKRRKKQ